MTNRRRMGTITTLMITLVVLSWTTLTSAEVFNYPTPQTDPNDISFYHAPARMQSYPAGATRVRNVILCIGDGMGLSQVTLARMRAIGAEGKIHMQRLPVHGLISTHSANRLVTDSAAAGTALACGIKTNNGMIGMTPDETPYCSILEAAQTRGMATGLVVTCTMSHATPAVFGAHVKSRKMQPEIAEQLIGNRINVLFGGGRKYFLPKSHSDSGRKDDRDLLAKAEDAGYTVIGTANQLRRVRGPLVLGLFQLDGLTTLSPEPMLAEMTKKAIDILDQTATDSRKYGRGFFLMVEGSQIDWACHANNAEACVRQTLLFDEAVRAAVDFAIADGRTLVVVTADHETGGLTIPEGNLKGDEIKVHWSTKGHTASPVPVYAIGPKSERFGGVYDNTEIAQRIAQVLGIKSFPQARK